MVYHLYMSGASCLVIKVPGTMGARKGGKRIVKCENVSIVRKEISW